MRLLLDRPRLLGLLALVAVVATAGGSTAG